MNQPVYFNAHHSPIGAFASFTFGCKGAKGGLGLELGGPADEPIYVGVEDATQPGRYHALPFFDGFESGSSGAESYDVEGMWELGRVRAVFAFDDGAVSREMSACIDTWSAGDLTFRVISPVLEVPDPESCDQNALRDALTPAVIAELTIDNRKGNRPRKAFFGYAGADTTAKMRTWSEGNIVGIAQGRTTAIATADPDVYAGTAWQPEAVLEPTADVNLPFMLGSLGLLVGTVLPGRRHTFKFAIAFFREGTATSGLETRYMYRRWFERIEDVACHALSHADHSIARATNIDKAIIARLTNTRHTMVAQAIRSYYGSTQCLETRDGKPIWLVNEGEYRMMNTFDLIVDQAFFELALNPWTVRNELDLYVDRYSYFDDASFPHDPNLYPAGIAFTHDMGVANTFSSPGYSGYEQAGLNGCFSYMSSEELVNWALTACLYVAHTGDLPWAESRKETFSDVIESMVNRDHPDPVLRNGVMGLDGARCMGGKEITTYDSLDASLGQARNNLYLAVKCWAAYLLLERTVRSIGLNHLADQAAGQATRAALTIVKSADTEGLLPAVIGECVEARIIPAIEGLAYVYVGGRPEALSPEGPFDKLIATLVRHFDGVLKSEVCLFPDGAWKLSSTSGNSWLSKIYLCQFVAEHVLGKTPDTNADEVHLGWLMDERNRYYAWSDQMLNGVAVGSRYYPRGVTGALWLANVGEPPIPAIRDVFCRVLEWADKI